MEDSVIDSIKDTFEENYEDAAKFFKKLKVAIWIIEVFVGAFLIMAGCLLSKAKQEVVDLNKSMHSEFRKIRS